jgi:putative membrane protein
VVPAVPLLTPLPPLHVGASISWTNFTVHWSTVIGLAALAALYEWADRRVRFASSMTGENEILPEEPTGVKRIATQAPRLYFYSGLAVIFLSLNGWLHDLSDWYLFSAHMVQHLLLTLLVPPLLLAGTPGWRLRPALRFRPVAVVARFVTSPKIAFAVFNIVLAAWHVPALYNTAMANHNVHVLQHMMFMVAAVLLWWPILSPLPELPRLSYPMQMLYLFLATLPMSIVAVYITYSSNLLYPAYAAAPRILGILPLEDQLIGGLIMWIPGGLLFYGVISVIFFRWQKLGEDSAIAAQVGWRAPRKP